MHCASCITNTTSTPTTLYSFSFSPENPDPFTALHSTHCGGSETSAPCHTNAYASIKDDDSATKTCTDYFKDYSSDARACFPVVPVEDFYAACMKDKADFCKIAKAYYTTCTLYGALVSLPPQCVECNAVKGSGFSGENEKEYNVVGVDVVFVMQEAQ